MASWMRTDFAAAARDVGEAEIVAAAGARSIAVPPGDVALTQALAASPGQFCVMVEARDADEARALADAGATWIGVACDLREPLARGGGGSAVARIPLARIEDAALWAALRSRGFTAAAPEPGPSGKLAESWGMTALGAFATHCRAHGLAFGFGGGLEAPDAPRLLALKPRWILFDEALRESGALSPTKLRAAAALFRDAGDARASVKTLERVFLRDLVVDMSIGVYDRERRRKQPARFTVEVDLDPVEGEVVFADIFTYDVVIDHIRALAAHGHHDLVETLADDVARAALGHRRARAVRVVVEKLAVIEGSVGVELRREKPTAQE